MFNCERRNLIDQISHAGGDDLFFGIKIFSKIKRTALLWVFATAVAFCGYARPTGPPIARTTFEALKLYFFSAIDGVTFW